MLVTVRATLKTGAAANVRSPIRPHVGTDPVSGRLGTPTASRSGYFVSLSQVAATKKAPSMLTGLTHVLSAAGGLGREGPNDNGRVTGITPAQSTAVKRNARYGTPSVAHGV
jgi:hypothetical protein